MNEVSIFSLNNEHETSLTHSYFSSLEVAENLISGTPFRNLPRALKSYNPVSIIAIVITYDFTRPQVLDAHLALELTIISCSSCMRQDSHQALDYKTPLEYAQETFFKVLPMWSARTFHCKRTRAVL